MTRLRRVLAAAGPAVLAGALAPGCSGPGAPARPSATSAASSSALTAPATTPAAAGSCHAGVSGAENWIMGSGELSAAESAGAPSVRYAVSRAHLFVLLLRGQSSTAGEQVADFRSYAEFRKMLRQGSIPAGIRWVMYDNEQWSLTPAAEQADPVRYERLFAGLAHQQGYRVILAPAQDLVPGFDKNSFRAGQAVWKSYLAMGLASASARVADVYEIQAQPYELGVYRSQHAYASFVLAAAAQARAANPAVAIYAGLSTQRVSDAAQLLQDYLATRGVVDGYWLNIPRHDQPGPPALADQFLRALPAAASARAVGCGGT
jgi:hypothetical protein